MRNFVYLSAQLHMKPCWICETNWIHALMKPESIKMKLWLWHVLNLAVRKTCLIHYDFFYEKLKAYRWLNWNCVISNFIILIHAYKMPNEIVRCCCTSLLIRYSNSGMQFDNTWFYGLTSANVWTYNLQYCVLQPKKII